MHRKFMVVVECGLRSAAGQTGGEHHQGTVPGESD